MDDIILEPEARQQELEAPQDGDAETSPRQVTDCLSDTEPLVAFFRNRPYHATGRRHQRR